MDTRRWQIGTTRLAATLVVVAAMALTACGGGESSADTSPPTTGADAAATDRSDDSDANDTDTDDGSADAPDPVLLLPHEADVPAGFRALPATCKSNTGDAADSDSADGEDRYTTWVTYAVPEDWDSVGRGSSGSGGVTGTNEDLTFQLPSGDRVSIDVDWDYLDHEGNIMVLGEPWETFDFEVTHGDDTKLITYETVGTVRIDDQDAELLFLDPSQDPDWQSPTYKVRVNAFELPARDHTGGGYKLQAQPFVMTFNVDTDADVSTELVEEIASTLMFSECAWETVLLDHELMAGIDLDGDGHVRSPEDVQRELEQMMEDAGIEVPSFDE